MEIVAVVLAGLSLLVAIVGTALSNRRSSEALTESRRANSALLWSAAQEAVQRLIGFDPNAEPLGDRLANLRIAMIALVDELDDFAGLDQWLEAERALGAVLGLQVMQRAKPTDTVDERLRMLEPYQTWAQALGSNLRLFRNQGHDSDAAARLRDHAQELTRQVYTRNGWVEPPPMNPGIEALDR